MPAGSRRSEVASAYEAGDMKLIPAAEAFARVKAQIGKRARNKGK